MRPTFFQVAGTGNATDHHAEHDQADEHLYQLDKAVAEGFQLEGDLREAEAANDTKGQP